MSENNVIRVVKAYYEVKNIRDSNYRRYLKAASRLLRRADGDIDLVFEKLRVARKWFQGKGLSWNMDTVTRHFHELHPSAPEKEPVVEIDKGIESLHELIKKRYGGRTS